MPAALASAQPRKQTKLWTARDGYRLRICDMSDSHLLNAIRLLERATAVARNQLIAEAESALDFLQGEMAIYAVEADLQRLVTKGLEPSEIYPIYDNLVEDALRRDLQFEG